MEEEKRSPEQSEGKEQEKKEEEKKEEKAPCMGVAGEALGIIGKIGSLISGIFGGGGKKKE